MRLAMVLGSVVMVLGCGGMGGEGGSVGGASASNGSEAAQKLCTYLAKEKETPCTALGPTKEVEMEGFRVVLNEVSTWTWEGGIRQDPGPAAKLKKAGNNTLVLDLSYTNTGPMKAALQPKIWVVTPEGEAATRSTYLDRSHHAEHADRGYVEVGSRTQLKANETVRTANTFILPANLVKGSLMYMATNEKRRDPEDPRGRQKLFWDNLVVIELGPPT